MLPRTPTLTVALLLCSTGTLTAQDIDFQRDIRPILSQACFQCHGPDEMHREGELRLDTREGILEAVAAGAGAASELVKRITSADSEIQMPPPDSGKILKSEQIALLTRWVESGAKWNEHWAFVPPQKPKLPATTSHEHWNKNPIDRFVAARMEQAGLAPAKPAATETLVRRLHLDLTGLPPSRDEAQRFLEDPSSEKYDALVEQLLDSSHYGEKWARHWLDAARYADSDGFEKDKPRQVWMYRDWVVAALNRDLPYNQFVVEQIAGDLLPSPSQDQLVATGFLRNSMLNEEGGIDPEQFRMEAMFDRMDAIGKAMLGITIQCAQCHSHKYDPITHDDYYRLFAFINNSHEGSLPVFPADQLATRQRILASIDAAEEKLRKENPAWLDSAAEWVRTVRGNQPEWHVLELHNANDNSQRYFRQPDGSTLAQGYAPTRFDGQFTAATDAVQIRAFRLELLTDPNLPSGGPGRSVDGLLALTEFRVDIEESDGKKQTLKFVEATADYGNAETVLGEKFSDREGKRRTTGPVSMAIDGNDETAWGIDAGPGRRNVTRNAVFVIESLVDLAPDSVLRIRLSQKHGGWNSDDNQNLNLGRFRISVAADPAVADSLPPNVRAMVESDKSIQALSAADQRTLFSHFRTTVDGWQSTNEEIEKLWAAHPVGTTQLVMGERSEPRETSRLERGDFLKPANKVAPGVPAFLHELPPKTQATDAVPNRLDLANWLVDPNNPTVARSIVNRVWQAYFGVGIVATSEDFGSQGAPPTHPDLLDWLAVEFIEHDWSLKWLHRQIVTSSAYRQSSASSAEQKATDPTNRFLARFPRVRLDAELVRDVTLSASGLLDPTIGGPGVYPPAPEYLFLPPASYGPKTWTVEDGPSRYRRALYTFRFRSVPYPALAVFDAPTADTSCTRRPRSNTPLQALTTLNEPLFVEAAKALALRTLREGGDTDDAKLQFAFQNCLTRSPNDQERIILSSLLKDVRERFAVDKESAQAFVGVGAVAGKDLPGDAAAGDAVEEVATWMTVCRVILNLDEMITKE
jgi:hypothetical protein